MRRTGCRCGVQMVTLAPLLLLGGCVSGPQIRDFLITETARVLSDVVSEFLGTLLSSGLPVQ